ncbi:uncharacterized protein [Argopecten irradians]|uniref:uncharacterized protein n=1 Tax=Argopecten irradians TaxID=31199 RepID=UPI00371577EF
MDVPDIDRKEVRRPMNAFLIFCKRHRTIVREKNPHLDNRSVTRILGDLWANLQDEEKSQYTDLAKQYKDAFMKANPDYKWHNPDRLGHSQTVKPITRPSNIRLGRDESDLPLEGSITPGKLADPSNMGGLSNLLVDKPLTLTDKASSSKSATTPTSSVASLMDLAMMCSSELSEDHMINHGHQENSEVLDPKTNSEIKVDHEDVRKNDSSGDSSDAERGWSSNHSCEEYNLPRIRSSTDNISDKSGLPSGDREGVAKVEAGQGRLSSPGKFTSLSGTIPKHPSDENKPSLPSFLTKRSAHELIRGESGFSGRKRCFSETSVDIYSDRRKLPEMLEGNKEESYQSSERDFGDGDSAEDGLHPVRKSKRRNRGQRYQELINEGIIQPSKERMAVIKVETENSRNDQDSSEEEMVPRPVGDLGYDVLSVYPRQIRKRTCSESEKTRSVHEDMQRYKTGDFDLEAHIATLPACSLEKVSRNSKRPAGKVRSMSESCGRNMSDTINVLTSAPSNTPTTVDVPVPEVVLTVPPHLKPNKQAEPVTGSQRRKARKHSVTHLQLVRPQEKVKTEESKPEKKVELCQPQSGIVTTANSDSHQDMIKSELTWEAKGQSSVVKGNETDNQQSDVKEDRGSSPSTLNACNMIDNILVSLADRKEETSLGGKQNTEAGSKKDDSLQESAVSFPPLNTIRGVASLPSETVAIDTSSPPVTSVVDTSSSLDKSSLSEVGTREFTSIKNYDQPKSLCILPMASSVVPCVRSVDSAATCVPNAMGSNSSQLDNSSSDKTADSRMNNSDNVSNVHGAITMPTTSAASSSFMSMPCAEGPITSAASGSSYMSEIKCGSGPPTSVAGGSYMTEVVCVAGQEYKVNPPQPVAVVNS